MIIDYVMIIDRYIVVFINLKSEIPGTYIHSILIAIAIGIVSISQ